MGCQCEWRRRRGEGRVKGGIERTGEKQKVRMRTCMRCSRSSTNGRKCAKAMTPSMRIMSMMVS